MAESMSGKEVKKLIKELEKEMLEAVRKLEFEKAALLRDQISFLQEGSKGSLSFPAQEGAPRKYGKRRKYGKSK